MDKGNFFRNPTRGDIVYYLSKESLTEIINMRINYNINARDSDCDGVKKIQRGVQSSINFSHGEGEHRNNDAI